MNCRYSNDHLPFHQFDFDINPLKWWDLNKRLVSGKNFKAIASVVYLVGMTKIKNNF